MARYELVATDTPPTDRPVAAPGTGAPRTRLQLASRIVSALLLVVVTLVVILLVAITVGPRVFPYQALVVRSGSMSPAIPTGSIVFYRSVASDKVKVGDVIVFNEPGETNKKVTHRVYQISTDATGRYFTTKGDANGTPDDWRVPAVGKGWIAVFHIPVVGYVLYDLQSTLARLLLLLVPAVLLGAITLYEIWHDRGKPRGTPA
jgi:signal peptidase I